MDFEAAFFGLTGNQPLSWQRRLFEEHFANGTFPGVIDLPTGLGKTMVMALWLIARALQGRTIPTRLVYVVDRRTVVDQATDLAKKLVENWGKSGLAGNPPVISTLRGQLADNREWSRDPSQPAIIVGTVDLIGSSLLFSGYRSSFKRRPLEAGLLGQDSLLVLDEAHLSQPFEKLLQSIGTFNQRGDDSTFPVMPMRVIRMSATSAVDSQADVFGLEGHFESRTGDFADDDVRKRYGATKRLTVIPLVEKKLTDQLAGEAIQLAEDESKLGKRIVIFVRRPDDAREVAEAIRKHAVETTDGESPKPKRVKHTLYKDSVEVLTGTMRGYERDKLVEKDVFRDRWLNGDLAPDAPSNQAPVFLVSTSAGEVGFDLNADHLVGDEAPLESWIQRLGRVNRRGLGNATVILVKRPEPADKTDFDLACTATTNLFRDGMDAGPRALAAFKESLPAESIAAASSPKPTTVELTDILLDAWSMTSITEPMPGRPEVGPWLCGVDEKQAQTTVAWRAELDLVRDAPWPEKALQAIFAKHPIRPHESLTVSTGRLLDFLKQIHRLKDRSDDLMSTLLAVRFPRGQVVRRTVLELTENPDFLYADATLVLPARFGGLDSAGLLDADFVSKEPGDGEDNPRSLDVADDPGYRSPDGGPSRLRVLIKRQEDNSWTVSPLPGGAPLPEDVFDAEYDNSTELFNALKSAGRRVRLRQPIHFDENDDADQSLVLLAPALASKGTQEDQCLADHVGAVVEHAERIADSMGLAEGNPIRAAQLFAAKWHDEGKKASIWQYFAMNQDPHGPPLGKMAHSRDPKVLRGYRHEFGSLLRVRHPERCDTAGCDPPDAPDAHELALHLIATHHGAGRPHFGHALYDPFTDAERDDLHTEIIRRFARLQRKYGWWRLAWLENLLRCADALASADDEVTEIDELDGVEP